MINNIKQTKSYKTYLIQKTAVFGREDRWILQKFDSQAHVSLSLLDFVMTETA